MKNMAGVRDRRDGEGWGRERTGKGRREYTRIAKKCIFNKGFASWKARVRIVK